MAADQSSDLLVSIGADLSQLQAGLQDVGPLVQRATSGLGASLAPIGNAAAAVGREVTDLTDALKQIAVVQREQSAALQALAAGFAGAGDASSGLNDFIAGLKEGMVGALDDFRAGAEAAADGLKPLGEEADDATDPVEGLGRALETVAEKSEEVGKRQLDFTFPGLAGAPKAVGQLGFNFTDLKARMDQVPMSVRAVNGELGQIDGAAKKGRTGVMGLYDMFREFRASNMQTGRVARFLTNELGTMAGVAGDTKQRLGGLMSIFIEGAAGGIGFGLALEGVKYVMNAVSESFQRAKQAALEYREAIYSMNTDIARTARGISDAFGPTLTKAQEFARDKTRKIGDDLDDMWEKFDAENANTSSFKFIFDRITPGDDLIQKYDRLAQKMVALDAIRKSFDAGWNVDAQRVALEENIREEDKIQREITALRAREGGEQARIAQETEERILEIRRAAAGLLAQDPNYRALLEQKIAAVREQGERQALAASEAANQQQRDARLRYALLTASDEERITLQTRATVERLRSQQRVTTDPEEKAAFEDRIRWAQAEGAQQQRALAAQTAARERMAVIEHQRAAAATEGQRIEADGQRALATLFAEFETNKERWHAADVERWMQRAQMAQEETAWRLQAWQVQQQMEGDKRDQANEDATIEAIAKEMAVRQQARELKKAGWDQEAADQVRAAQGAYEAEVGLMAALNATKEMSDEEYQRRTGEAKVKRDAAIWQAQHQNATAFMNTLASTWQSGIARMMEGTLSFRDGMAGIWQTVRASFASVAAGMLTDWMKTVALKLIVSKGAAVKEVAIEVWAATAKTAANAWSALKTIAMKAYEAAAGAYSAIAQIPVVGPFIAPGIAAATLAAVIGLGAKIASAAQGYDIPSGVNPLVQAHAEEMVLPAKLANPLRKMLEGGEEGASFGGGGSTTVNVALSGVDGPSIMRMMRSNEGKSALTTAIAEALRDGRMGRS